jgi:hypothetical protein
LHTVIRYTRSDLLLSMICKPKQRSCGVSYFLMFVCESGCVMRKLRHSLRWLDRSRNTSTGMVVGRSLSHSLFISTINPNGHVDLDVVYTHAWPHRRLTVKFLLRAPAPCFKPLFYRHFFDLKKLMRKTHFGGDFVPWRCRKSEERHIKDRGRVVHLRCSGIGANAKLTLSTQLHKIGLPTHPDPVAARVKR